jgi:serine protease Do
MYENDSNQTGSTENTANTVNTENTANAESTESTANASYTGASYTGASGTESTASASYAGTASTGSEYRYSGPFYQDTYSTGSASGGSSAGNAGSARHTGRTAEGKTKKNNKFFRLVAKTVCVALIFGVVASAAFQGTNYLGKKAFGSAVTAEGEEESPTYEVNSVTPQADSLTQQSTGAESSADVSAIVEECMPSLVAITNISVTEVQNYWGFGFYNTPQQKEESSTGTGIIIGQNDTELLIVTNNHVISGATTLTVLFSVDEDKEDASAVEAQIKGTDATKDIGVIAVPLSEIPEDTLSEIKIASIGDSSQLKVGESVIAIGNALGYGQSVTTGIVSALDREVSLESDDGTTINNKLIQTDAAINPGNSGGALLNMNGEVIGINEAKLSSSYVEGMGYAIPISDVEGVIGDLQSLTTRSQVGEDEMGYLGINCQDVTEDISKQYDMPVGVYLKSVVEGCAADQAGLKKGDILTKFDGVTITSYDTLRERLQYYSAGETVEVTVQTPNGAEYTEKTVTLTLSTKAAVQAAANQ